MFRESSTPLLLLKAALALLAFRLAYFLYEGISWRLRFRRLKAQGVPILEHSLLFGHLKTFKKLKSLFPRDAGSVRVVPLYILDHWKELFPNESECPKFLCVDTWPLEPPLLLVWDPEQIHRFTVESPASRDHKYLMDPVTGGHDLLSVDRPAHREWRARFSSGFSMRNLFAHMPTFLEEVDIFVSKIRHLAGSDGAWGDVFQLEEPATSLTLDVIGRFALDARLGDQTSGESAFGSAMMERIKEMKTSSLKASAQRMTPVWQYRNWRDHQVMDSVILPQIRDRIGSPQATPKSPALIDLVLKDGGKEKNTKTIAQNSKLVKGLVSNIKAFAFAGHDTTATTICWCFYNLWRYPAVLAKLQAEHDEVFGPNPRHAPDVLLKSPQKINELPYTLAVIKETLRVYAIVHSFRKGEDSLQLTTNGVRIGTRNFLVVVAAAALHLHPDLWYKAKEFIPERWLVPKGDPLYPPPHTWRPFEHGPMDCIGQGLAIIELKLVLVRLVREVEIEPAWDKWDQLRGFTEKDKKTVDDQRAYPTNRGGGLLKPKEGLPVHVRMRPLHNVETP